MDNSYLNLVTKAAFIKESVEEFDCIEYVTLFLKKYNIKNEDYDRVYEMILNDFKNARIGKISLDRI